jgi:hypothetical protein
MTGNKIENTGGMLFAAMLQMNSSLEKLDLGDCDLVRKLVNRKATRAAQRAAQDGGQMMMKFAVCFAKSFWHVAQASLNLQFYLHLPSAGIAHICCYPDKTIY